MKRTMTKYILLIIFSFMALVSFAQKERKYVREGNGYFEKGLKDTTKLDTVNFSKAEVAYRRALEIKPDDFHWQFNLADAIYKQNRPDQAAAEFERLLEKTDKPNEKAMLYHNLGNSLLVQKKFDPSIEAYKKALRINPNDLDTKYNLAYAIKMKEQDQKQQQQQQNQQNQNQNQNKNQDQKENQDKNDDQNKNKDQNKDNNNQNNPEQNKEQQQQNKISPQSAEQILKALENDEKKTQEKVKKAQAEQAKQRKVEKNW